MEIPKKEKKQSSLTAQKLAPDQSRSIFSWRHFPDGLVVLEYNLLIVKDLGWLSALFPWFFVVFYGILRPLLESSQLAIIVN